MLLTDRITTFTSALAIGTALSLASSTTCAQQTTSQPGGMKKNGNFFVESYWQGDTLTWHWEYDEATRTWILGGTIPNAKLNGPPRAATTTGGVHILGTSPTSGIPKLDRWDPNPIPGNWGVVTPLGTPAGPITSMSSPSEVMYGNRVYLVGEGPGNYGKLYERFTNGSGGVWFNFGYPFNQQYLSLRLAPPCVLYDGKLFVVTDTGKLVEMWWNGTWNWGVHPAPASGVGVIFVGAPMPTSDKVFVTCTDGTLRHRYWNGNGWTWANNGTPGPGYKVVGTPVSISDGQLFVTATNSVGTLVLCHLWWSGSTWLWGIHNNPPGANITGELTTSYGLTQVSPRVAMKATNGKFYLRYWDYMSNGFQWRDCGTPPW